MKTILSRTALQYSGHISYSQVRKAGAVNAARWGS